MEKIYRVLLVAVCAVGILFGLQYFLPITAQYLNVPGVEGIPGLPSMPTIAYQPTTAPLPIVTLQLTPSTPAGFFFFATASPTSAGLATNTLTPVPDATASATLPSGVLATQTSIRPRPSVTPLPSFTPIPVPSATANFGGPCNNVLYPVRQGQSWQYRVIAQGRTTQLNMDVVGVSGQHATVIVTNLTSGARSQTTVDCNNGAINSFPSVVGSLILNNVTLGSLNVNFVDGVLAPDQTAFQNSNWGLQWSARYQLSGSATVPYQGHNITLALSNSPLTLTCTTAGVGAGAFESITVSGVSYPQALKVICQASGLVTGTLNGNPVNGTISGSSTQWFGINTGLLRLRVDSSNIDLLGISLPLNLQSQVELLHFQPAP